MMSPRLRPLNHPWSVRGVPATKAPVHISLPLSEWSRLLLVRSHTWWSRWVVVFVEWLICHRLIDVSCNVPYHLVLAGAWSMTILIFRIFIIISLHSLKIVVTLKQVKWKLTNFFSGGISSYLLHLDIKDLMHITLDSSVFIDTNVSDYRPQATENKSVALTLRKHRRENWLIIITISDVVNGCILPLFFVYAFRSSLTGEWLASTGKVFDELWCGTSGSHWQHTTTWLFRLIRTRMLRILLIFLTDR